MRKHRFLIITIKSLRRRLIYHRQQSFGEIWIFFFFFFVRNFNLISIWMDFEETCALVIYLSKINRNDGSTMLYIIITTSKWNVFFFVFFGRRLLCFCYAFNDDHDDDNRSEWKKRKSIEIWIFVEDSKRPFPFRHLHTKNMYSDHEINVQAKESEKVETSMDCNMLMRHLNRIEAKLILPIISYLLSRQYW